MRALNIIVIVTLILAAAFVYEIKLESTLQAEQLAKLRGQIRRERDAIAILRAEWAKLDNPARIQGLAQRHLPLQPLATIQIDNLDRLPERPPQIVMPGSSDPIGAIIDREVENITDLPTGSIPVPAERH